MKKKIFLLGDFESDNGPGVANKLLHEVWGCDSNCVFSNKRGFVQRVLEIFKQVKDCDILFICNYTRLHAFAAALAKKRGKRCVYRLHGYALYEAMLNENDILQSKLAKIKKAEEIILKNADWVICVSRLSMEFMKKVEPEYANKYTFAYNGININEIEAQVRMLTEKRIINQILSIGGGVRQKNNRKVCEAIGILNKKGFALKYVIVGQSGMDKGELCSFDFVEYYDSLPRIEIIRMMLKSNIYIQNSYMETFGIAVIEAIVSGCNILLAKNVGAIEIIDTIKSNDIIEDNMDSNEIAGKIELLLQNGNNQRIRSGLQVDKVDKEETMQILFDNIVGEK